jgi:hypothetical protein
MIEDDLFVAAPKRPSVPHRDRGTMPPRCIRFAGDNGFELFVTPDAAGALRKRTRADAPNETLALLRGRAFRDSSGEYTVVNGVHHPAIQRGPGHVHLSAADAARAQADATSRYPLEDPVGWSHSHHSDSGYSSVDREEQAAWNAAHHVGILTFMDGDRWRAYRGPKSEQLRLTSWPNGVSPESTPADTPVAAAPPMGGARPPAARRAPVRRLPRPRPRTLVLAGVTALVIAAVLGATQLTRDATPAALRWSCTTVTSPTGNLECVGPLGQGVTGWLWSVDSGEWQEGPTLDYFVYGPGQHTVRLVLQTPAGSLDDGSRVVDIGGDSATGTGRQGHSG